MLTLLRSNFEVMCAEVLCYETMSNFLEVKNGTKWKFEMLSLIASFHIDFVFHSLYVTLFMWITLTKACFCPMVNLLMYNESH